MPNRPLLFTLFGAVLLLANHRLFGRILAQIHARDGIVGAKLRSQTPYKYFTLPIQLSNMLDARFALFQPSVAARPLRSALLEHVELQIRHGRVEGGRDPFNAMIKRAVKSSPVSVKDQSVIFSSMDFPSMLSATPKSTGRLGLPAVPIAGPPEFAAQTSPHFYDIPFPTHTRHIFSTKFERIRRENLRAGTLLPFSDKRSAAIWRGKIGESGTGCGPLGHMFFPSQHIIGCVDQSPRANGVHPDAVGYTSAAEMGTWRQHPRYRLVELSLRQRVCDAGAELDFRFVWNHNYWCVDTIRCIYVVVIAVVIFIVAVIDASAKAGIGFALAIRLALAQRLALWPRRKIKLAAMSSVVIFFTLSLVVSGVPALCRSPEDNLLQVFVNTRVHCSLIFTFNQAFTMRVTLGDFLIAHRHSVPEMVAPRVDYSVFARNRYIINIGNNGFADSFWAKLAVGSVVLHVETPYFEWFEPLLEPMVHYVPVKEDLSDLCERLDYLERNPKIAEEIAKRGRDFVENTLTVELVNQYVLDVLRRNAQYNSTGQ